MDGVEVVNVAEQRRCRMLPNYPAKVHAATGKFYNGHIVACGGFVLVGGGSGSGSESETDSCHKYRLSNERWDGFGSLLGPVTQGRSATINDKFWITGGSSTPPKAQHYDEDANAFVFGHNLPMLLKSHCFVQINSTHVFLSDISGLSPPAYKLSAYLINWETGEHTNLPEVPDQRTLASCGLTWTSNKGLEIVVVGNEDTQNVNSHGTSSIFSLSNMSWRDGPSVGQNVFGAALAQIDHTFVLTGGVQSTNRLEYADTVMRYDPEEELFVTLEFTLGTVRAYHVALSVPNDMIPCPGKKLYFEVLPFFVLLVGQYLK